MDTMTINGRVYLSHDCWTFGDYGGAGPLGRANINVLSEECAGRIVECGMNTLRHIQEGCPYGLGADELAEIKTERPWMILAVGDYGGEQAWVRKPLATRCRDWIDQMDRYPSLSDDEISRVEMEWETEAWDGWLKHDLIRTLDDDTQEAIDRLAEGDLQDAYRAAMEETNTYPEAEYSGVAIDVDRIAESFARHIKAKLDE